jgi:NADH pyrophosphatase NudC (nudix superfamily)
MEIKLQKRYKYAGDILEALIEKAGFPLDVAGEFLNSIKDAEVIEQRHGEWCWEGKFKACSRCGSYVEWNETLGANFRKFCPYCGTKMDGGTP